MNVRQSVLATSTIVFSLGLGAPALAVDDVARESNAPAAPPKRELRPLSTDRPDVTESPYSVDAGHFQMEMDAARYTSDAGLASYSFANTNLKVGITDFWDMQVVVESLVGIEGPTGYDWGFGDITLRGKFNIFGNDSGELGLGLLPWVKLPTSGTRGNGRVDAGVAAILGAELPLDFSGGIQVQTDMAHDEVGDGRHFELLTTATLGHPIVGPFGAFVEVFGIYSSEVGSDYVFSFNGGVTCLVTEQVLLDAGLAAGITDAAEDVSVFTGVSFKL